MRPTNRRQILGATMAAAAMVIGGCSGTDSTHSTGADTEVVPVSDTDPEVVMGGADTAAAATSTSAGTDIENQSSHFDTEDLAYDESDVVGVSLDGTSAAADSNDVAIDGTTVVIGAGGTYSLSGTLADGEVIVDAGDDDVTVILDGVDITNADGAALAIMNADDAIVLLADGSTNSLTDGATYSFPAAGIDEPNAALYSSADLTIAGDGELIVVAEYNDGITSKDGLVFYAGDISVMAADDGIRGKDYVLIEGGTITVEAAGDGIKADNEDDAELGAVQITDGTIDITAGDDGVQAATDVLVAGGTVTIDAGSVSGTGRAIQGDVMVHVSGGMIDATAIDDAIHSNESVTVDGGSITVAAGDDGIHGDLAVTVNGGSITVTEAFEGIEAEVITINDGAIDITSRDDGLNVAGSETEAATATTPAGGRGGRGGAEAVGEYYVYINGGTTVITILGELDEQGDGIDANGHVVMTDGVVVISGPTDTRNSAFDYSGGTFVMTGGTIIGTNVDGRNSEGVGIGSSQASLYITTGSTMAAGTVAHIENADGETLVTFEPVNDYSVIVFSSPDLVDGQAYDVYLGGTITGDSATGMYEDSEYTIGEHAGTVIASVSA